VLAYLGEPAIVDDLLYRGDVSLVRQATDSRLMQLLNLGGFGLAAWDPRSPEPSRPFTYRTAGVPMFDRNLKALSEKVQAQALVAHVRGVIYAPSERGGLQNVHPFLFDGAQYVASGRVTAMAIAPTCSANNCRLYVAAAGGGVWRTDKALNGSNWEFVSDSFGTNAIGSLLIDPSDASGNTLYAGTGEPNASNDSEAGVGIYKTTDGGATWGLVAGSDIFFQRSIGQMALDNAGNLLVPIASAVRGISFVQRVQYHNSMGGLSSAAPPHSTRGTGTVVAAIVSTTRRCTPRS